MPDLRVPPALPPWPRRKWWQRRRAPLTFSEEMDLARALAATPERIALAERERIHPRFLRTDMWSGETMLTPDLLHPSNAQPPCGRCGHPRWAHATALSFDGLCICGCNACAGAGYEPGRPR